jgi:4,5-dihydroxyphthalate decarboxylase
LQVIAMTPDDTPTLATTSSDIPASEESALTLKVAMADYDRIRPLMDGRVRAEGLALDITTDDIREFCVGPVYESFDVAEMSMSWYVAARARGEPCIALPIFPLRMAVLGYLYCHTDAPYTRPADLKGKRIGSPAYRYTVNLWLRGMLAEHYGLRPEDMAWVTNEEEINGYAIPGGIDLTVVPDTGPGQLLIDGEIDAIMSPEPPPEFAAGDPRIRRLFPDARAEQIAYYEKTGIYPITHTVVMHQEMARAKPWVAERLVVAFRAAQRLVEDYYHASPKRLSLPGAAFIVEDERRAYGPEPWSHGVAGNRHTIETFVRYAREQGYIDRDIPIEEFFAGNTLEI